MSARTVPWRDKTEWEALRGFLLSSAELDRQVGLQLVTALESRGRVDLMVESTAALVRELLPEKAMSLDEITRQNSLSMTLVRVVNGICDTAQQGQTARSIAGIATELGLPEWIVDVRHHATHMMMPPIEVLESAALRTLVWLRHHYWHVQRPTKNTIPALLSRYHSQYIDYLQSQDEAQLAPGAQKKLVSVEESGLSRKKQKRMKRQLDKSGGTNVLGSFHLTLAEALSRRLAETIEELFVNLSEDGLRDELISPLLSAITAQADMDDRSLLQASLKVWGPLFRCIQLKYPTLGVVFVKFVVDYVSNGGAAHFLAVQWAVIVVDALPDPINCAKIDMDITPLKSVIPMLRSVICGILKRASVQLATSTSDHAIILRTALDKRSLALASTGCDQLEWIGCPLGELASGEQVDLILGNEYLTNYAANSEREKEQSSSKRRRK